MTDDTRVEHVVILLVDGRTARLDPGPNVPVTLEGIVSACAAAASEAAGVDVTATTGDVP
jgi:hypothetical protein